jgi:hypothetical protein
MEIKPKTGIGPIKLGMSMDQVKSVVKNCKPFKKTPTAPNITFDCGGKLHIHFDRSGKVIEIEAFNGSGASYKGQNLFNGSYAKAVYFLKRHDPSISIKRDEAVSKKLGIRLWTRGEGSLDSVLIER